MRARASRVARGPSARRRVTTRARARWMACAPRVVFVCANSTTCVSVYTYAQTVRRVFSSHRGRPRRRDDAAHDDATRRADAPDRGERRGRDARRRLERAADRRRGTATRGAERATRVSFKVQRLDAFVPPTRRGGARRRAKSDARGRGREERGRGRARARSDASMRMEKENEGVGTGGRGAVSYTHLTLPTILLV